MTRDLTTGATQENQQSYTGTDTLFGMDIEYNAQPVSLSESRLVMNEFFTAYSLQDRERLKNIIADDFEWYVHDGTDMPRGTLYKGVDQVLDVLEDRGKFWSNVTYSEIKVFSVGNRQYQEFRVTGSDSRYGVFDTYGIDVYVVRNGKVLSKDSYWKRQPKP